MRLLALVLMLSCLNAARLAAANCLARLEVLRRALGTQGRQAKPSSEEKMTKLPTVGSVWPRTSVLLPYTTTSENARGTQQATLAAYFSRESERSIKRASRSDDSE